MIEAELSTCLNPPYLHEKNSMHPTSLGFDFMWNGTENAFKTAKNTSKYGYYFAAKNTKSAILRYFAQYRTFTFYGEGGIRTLDELLTHTRVPVVRHKPG